MSPKSTDISQRAHGRSLQDFKIDEFKTPHGLFPAEEKLLEAARLGRSCDLGESVPRHATADNRIRASFLRFLLLGGDASAPIHEMGLMLQGAYIDGDIELVNAQGVCTLALEKCNVKGRLIGYDASLKDLYLTGSSILGIACDRARIDGDVFLDHKFYSKGEVGFAGALIKGSVTCTGGFFNNDMRGMRSKESEAATALSFARATVGGTLRIDSVSEKGAIEGSLDLQDARVASFADDPAAWPRDSQILANAIKLDGFTYGEFANASPLDPQTRIRWLRRQPKDHIGVDFRSQPFEQLVKVLRAMGHKEEARDVCFLKQRYYLKSRWLNFCRKPRTLVQKALKPFAFLWWRVLLRGVLEVLHIGFANLHVMTALLAVVLIGSGFLYRQAAIQGLFVPADTRVLFDKDLRLTCSSECVNLEQTCFSAPVSPSFASSANDVLVPRYSYLGRRQKFWPSMQYVDLTPPKAACLEACHPAWTSDSCGLAKAVPEYPRFSPFAFAVDAVLPTFVSLHQTDSWRVMRRPFSAGSLFEAGSYFVQGVIWFEGVFFWFWAFSALAVLRSTLRRD